MNELTPAEILEIINSRRGIGGRAGGLYTCLGIASERCTCAEASGIRPGKKSMFERRLSGTHE
jgi:hypothetical protein